MFATASGPTSPPRPAGYANTSSYTVTAANKTVLTLANPPELVWISAAATAPGWAT